MELNGLDPWQDGAGAGGPRTERLQTLRNTLERLSAAGGGQPGRRTDATALVTRADTLSPITRLHMGTFHANNGAGAAGCIGGVTITLFPEAARQAVWELITQRRWRPGRLPVPLPRIVAGILEAPHIDVCNLLFPAPEHYAIDYITPAEAATALDRFAAGLTPWPIEGAT